MATVPAQTAQFPDLVRVPGHAPNPQAEGLASDDKQPVISVLLVEDHEINRKLAAIMLERMGYRLSLANDGQQALALLAQQRFDVVLMDVMMPVMDGLAALRHLREQESLYGSRTPVLMVTAHAMTGDKERFMAAGADGYVSKPMSQAALQKEILRVTAQRGIAKQDRTQEG